MGKTVLKRNEQTVENTWNLQDIYPDDAAWEKEMRELSEAGEHLAGYAGKMAESAKTFYTALCESDHVDLLTDRVCSYASRKSDENTADSQNQAMEMRARTLYMEINEKTAFMQPEIMEISDEKLEQFMKEEPGLSLYSNMLKRIRRRKAHTLPTEMEALLASSGEVAGAPANIFSMFNDADLEFPEITDENGEKVRITHGRYIPLMECGKREVRKDAFEALYSTYGKFRNSLAAMFAGNVKSDIFFSKAKKYNSCLEAALDGNNVPTEVYKNLEEAVAANLDKMYRYVSLRKKILGYDELHMYDLYVPLVKEADVKIPYEEAKKTVYEALAPLGDEYRKILQEGFDNRWIDVYENEGKRSGAYSAGCFGVHPYVLLNYNETLDNEFTIAHEMGHALHSYLSDHNQPFVDSGYTIFVAEVASTCNEVLLMQYLLKRTTEKTARAYLINYFLESFRGTVYRQTMFAEFERITHEMSEAGESLTAEVLSDLYLKLNRKYYGEEMVLDPEIAMEWARIPHFYYNFYVYQYATGFSAAVALANRILKEGDKAVADYLKFLSGGCSKSPIELLKIAGVDMSTPKPVNEALSYFGELLDEMEALLDK